MRTRTHCCFQRHRSNCVPAQLPASICSEIAAQKICTPGNSRIILKISSFFTTDHLTPMETCIRVSSRSMLPKEKWLTEHGRPCYEQDSKGHCESIQNSAGPQGVVSTWMGLSRLTDRVESFGRNSSNVLKFGKLSNHSVHVDYWVWHVRKRERSWRLWKYVHWPNDVHSGRLKSKRKHSWAGLSSETGRIHI